MITNIKALILVLPILFGVFFVSRFVFKDIVAPKRIDMWRNIFIFVTIIGFLIPNFWFMIVILTIVMIAVVALRLEKNLAALFMLMVCALPPQEQPIPGFGGINQIFPISPPLLMSITVLLGGMFYSKRMFRKSQGVITTDIFMALFVLLSFVLAFRDTSFTDGLRFIWIFILTTFLPYFVFSRWANNLQELRVICVALLVPILSMAGVAILETGFKWHFYAMPSLNWHGPLASPYIFRSGILRAYASLIGPLEFGFVLVVTISIAMAVMRSHISKVMANFGMLGFAGALLFTFSRGPWLGAVIAVSSFTFTGPKGISRSFMALLIAMLGFAAILVTPLGPKVVSALPFIGESENDGDETINYRQRLFENGTEVIMEKPLFGSTTYYQHPKMIELTQGQGIIDLVNSYIQLALAKGLVGLFLFVGILLSATLAAFRAMGITKTDAPEFSAYARAFFSAMVAIIVVIGTTSSNPPLPIFYFLMSGLCVSACRLAKEGKLNGFATIMPDGEGVMPGAKNGAVEDQSGEGQYDPAHSMRAAQEAREQLVSQDAEAAALARRNAEKKRKVKQRDLPAHLRQYVNRDDD